MNKVWQLIFNLCDLNHELMQEEDVDKEALNIEYDSVIEELVTLIGPVDEH